MSSDFLPRFQKIFLCATEIYSREISSEHAKIFIELVSDYDISDIEKAFHQHMKSNKFFPVPVDIIGLIPKKRIQQKKGDMVLIDGNKRRFLN
jgi:hypothetical protein